MSVENILAIYKLATPEEKRDGIVWYADALRDCTRIAIDLPLTGPFSTRFSVHVFPAHHHSHCIRAHL